MRDNNAMECGLRPCIRQSVWEELDVERRETRLREHVQFPLLLTLGLVLPREVAALHIPQAGAPGLGTAGRKAGHCPALEENTVRVDMRILRQSQGTTVLQDFQNRSTSPWDYNVTRDPHRFPSEIAEARCRHAGCLDAQGREDSSMNAVAIQQEILVLRREPQGCAHSFRLEKMHVSVGCTCVRPVVHQVV
ncbi:interleukin-17F-like [Dipodomys spectabilis]|uniref:interleukin-17F-like n=1 Tax=Dipodomys spectabilis TaxID=105255 RepID=UPI001C54933B|nr:interleukin-17F-like [Dipodomys spectabilis]